MLLLDFDLKGRSTGSESLPLHIALRSCLGNKVMKQG